MSLFNRKPKEPRKTLAQSELQKISDLVATGTPEQREALGRRIVLVLPVLFAQAQLAVDPWEEQLFGQLKESAVKLFFRLRNPQTTCEELGDALLGDEGKVLQDLCVEAVKLFNEEQRRQGKPEIVGMAERKALGPVR
jgi:hypothetical protein